jgi:hypothetical protein
MGAAAREGDDDQERCRRSRSAEEVDGEPAGAHDVGECEHAGGDDERAEAEPGDDRQAAKLLSRLRRNSLALFERPVAELRGHEQPCGDDGRRRIEVRVVHGELDAVDPAEQQQREWKQPRPSEDERGNESQEREGRRPEADAYDDVTRARERVRCEPERARERADPRGYARARRA